MAQHALPAGAIRRRAVFGLLDAEGWSWAGIKALFWFLLTIFLLGYIPNLAYYFTVSDTVDVGYNFLSVVNWCPSGNKDLPCPAPAGAVVPWEPSPPELALPSARQGAVTVQSGVHLYLVGGTDADGSVIAETVETTATLDGNFQPWTEGPALPEPRTEAAYASLNGVPYIIGGLDAAGNPTDTVYVGILDAGVLTGWALANGENKLQDLTLKQPISGAVAVSVNNGFYLMGGRTAAGISDGVWRSLYEPKTIKLTPWELVDGLALPEPRTDAAAAYIGSYIYLAGGEGPRGVSSSVFRLQLDTGQPVLDPLTVGRAVIDPVTKLPKGWAVAPQDEQIPAPRARAATYTANGQLYIIGGVDDSDALQYTTLWAIPTSTGDLAWHYLDQSNLTVPQADASAAVVGPYAFLIGGESPDGLQAGALRGGLSPAPPFFRLGLFGATVPALSIKGEIGQQLGYINAMTVGMVNFGLLVAIGLAFSHRRQTLHLMERLSRGRFRAPRDDEFTPSS